MTLVAVAVGAALGAQLRFMTDRLLASRWDSVFPWGTLAVNTIGSFVLALLIGVSSATWVTAGLGAGLCGGMTTYSTFGYETVRLLRSGSALMGLLNAAANVAGGVGGVCLGLLLGTAAT